MNKVLLMVGSHRKDKSTSNSLGEYLLDNFKTIDIETDKLFVHSDYNQDEDRILMKVKWADLIILSFPLYVDSLPAPVIKSLEMIKKGKEKTKHKQFFAISNSGFPEAAHNNTALKVCRQFSEQMEWEWIGGLAVGMGAAVDGKSLEEIKGMGDNIIVKLDNIFDFIIIEGKGVGIVEVEPSIPKWLYVFMGNMGWRFQAIKNGVWKKLHNKPYEENKFL